MSKRSLCQSVIEYTSVPKYTIGVWRDIMVVWCDTYQCGGWWHGDHGDTVVAQAAGHGEDAKDADHFPERRSVRRDA